MSKFSRCVLVLGWLCKVRLDAKFISWSEILTIARHKLTPVAMVALFIPTSALFSLNMLVYGNSFLE